MRISDDRYSRDRMRIDVAVRFIHLEARTHTIRQWTGLTNDRIRKLFRAYVQGGDIEPNRHRGKSPHQAALFMRTARLRQEAALLASICQMIGLFAKESRLPKALPDVRRAQQLCQAFEAYRGLVPEPQINFEQAVLLLATLTNNEELAVDLCRSCEALVVVDRLSLRVPNCIACAVAPVRAAAA
jgi:hypothetical protein